MTDERPFENEREAWEYLRGPANRNRRRRYQRMFLKMFPEGHDASIRGLLEDAESKEVQAFIRSVPQLKHFRQIHPGAFRLLREYGRDYRPLVLRIPPDQQPEPGMCSRNSLVMQKMLNEQDTPPEKQAVYVEGIVSGVFAYPMLHAWNAGSLTGKIACDWTFYTLCQWLRYFGIPFTEDEYSEITRRAYPKKKWAFLLFDRMHFPKARIAILDVLKRRPKQRA